MSKPDNFLKLILIFLVCTFLDFSLPVLGINYYLFLTPILILYLVTGTKININIWLIFPFLILLDLHENFTLFGFYTLYFGVVFIFIDFLKKLIPRFILSYIFYILLFLLFFYLNSLSLSLKWYLWSAIEFSVFWYLLDRKVF